MSAAEAAAPPALTCRNCGQPLRRLVLRGHYGRPVEVDDCHACHLLWFDGLEAVRLSGSGMINLIREMAAGQSAPHRPLRPDLGCARCGGPLRQVVNRTRFGRSEQLECPRCRGTWYSHGQWLAERGLVREATLADARALALQGAARHCFNCGGPAGADDVGRCGWCGATAVLMDVGRLLQAVDPEGATRPPGAPTSTAYGDSATTGVDAACHACGDTRDGASALRCSGCGATRAAGDLGAALKALEAIEPALRAHEARPAEHVRARRLAALEQDLPRRRETIRTLEDQARRLDEADGAHGSAPGPFGGGWQPSATTWRLAAVAVTLVWLVWSVLGG